ncbi:OmpH family outer membrane protein [Nitrosomonas sp. PY1]|uniref:OmpH family outer membrane protein n=1 Tax=Nitrosomonas sp. PY1 TaxID=1803906 RepID=UPI0035D4B5AF
MRRLNYLQQNRFFLFFTVFGFLSMMVAGFAIFANNIKIGVVNTEKILRESSFALQAQKRIEQEFIPRDDEIKKMMAEARILQDKLEKNGAVIAHNERQNMERDLANLSRKYQRAQKQLREDFSARQNEEYSIILDRINNVISKIAEAEKFDLILQLQDSVYRSQRIDITDKIIKFLDDETMQ